MNSVLKFCIDCLFIFTGALAHAQASVECNSIQVRLTSADGTSSDFPTVQQAVNSANNGSKIDVGNLSTSESLSIRGKTGITIQSKCNAIISGILIYESQNVVIDGFKIAGAGGARADGVLIDGKGPISSNVLLVNNEVFGAELNGISVAKNSTNIRIEKNFVHSNGQNGIKIIDAGPCTLVSNAISKNGGDGVSGQIKTNDLALDKNIITENSGYGLNINPVKSSDSVIVTNNVIVGNKGHQTSKSSADIGSYSNIISGQDTGNSTTSGTEGGGGGSVSDTAAPVIAINIADGLRVNFSSLNVQVSVEDQSGVLARLYLNGSLVKESGLRTFSAPLSLQSGDNEINVQAIDQFGHSSSKSIVVVLDTVVPVLTSISPADSEIVRSPSGYVQILGIANESLASAKVNGMVFSVNAVNFNGEIDFGLGPGIKSLSIELTDLAGNVSATSINFELVTDQSAPTINFVSEPTSPTNVAESAFEVSVSDESSTTTSVFMNNLKIFESGDKTFSVPVHLGEGLNSFRFETVDIVGNAATPIEKTVVLDTAGPFLAVTPLNNAVVLTDDGKRVQVAVQANEFIQSITVNGVPMLGFGYNYSLPLFFPSEGQKVLHFEARDFLGNLSITDTYLNLIVDSVAPVIVIGLEDNVFTSQPSISLPVEVSDEHQTLTRIFVNGTLFIETTAKSIVPLIALNDGKNVVTVTSVDEAGNQADTKSLQSIILDRVAPTLTLLSPFQGQLFDDPNVAVSGFSDEALTSLAINGEAGQLSIQGTTFSKTVNFPSTQSEQTVHIEGRDRAGNVARLDVPVYVRPLIEQSVALVVSRNLGRIQVIDQNTKTLVREINLANGNVTDPGFTSGGPDSVILDVRSQKAFVVENEFDQVHVISIADGSSLQTNDLRVEDVDTRPPFRPFSISSTGLHLAFGRAYVAAGELDPESPEDPVAPEVLGGVLLYDTQASAFASIDLSGVSVEGLAFDPTGTELFLSTNHNFVSVLDLASRSVSRQIQIPISDFKSKGVAITGDGSKLLVVGDSDKVIILNPSTGDLIQTVSILNSGSRVRDVIIRRDNLVAYLISEDSQSGFVSRLDLSSNSILQVTNLGFLPSGAALDRDENNIWVSDLVSDQVKVLSTSNFAVTESISVPFPAGIAFGVLNAQSTENLPPLATFSVQPSNPIAPANIIFDASGSVDLDGQIVSRTWSFSDGGIAAGEKVFKTYNNPGEYSATLTVVDDQGSSRSKSITFGIFDKLTPPIARFDYKRISDFGLLRIDFDASGSTKAGGSIAKYMWDFGDGSSGEGISIQHTYSQSGDYFVQLTVIDEFNIQSVITKSISVEDITPLKILVSSPRAGELFRTSQVDLMGMTDEPASYVKINGSTIPLNVDNQTFQSVVGLNVEGRNIIIIEAADLKGNSTKLNYPIFVDTVLPSLTEFMPTEGSTVYRRSNTMPVSFNASEALSTLSISGIQYPVSKTGLDYALSIPVIEGSNQVSVALSDLAGNSNTLALNYNVIIDNVSPAISTDVDDGLITKISNFSLPISIDDQSPVTTNVELGGMPIGIGFGSSFSVESTLSSGANTFRIESTDAAGNLSAKSISVILDQVAPSIKLSVANGSYTNNPNLSLGVYLHEEYPLTSGVYLNGTLVSSSQASFFNSSLLLSEGSNLIVVTSRDKAGNESSEQVVVNLDTLPPILSDILPHEGDVVTERGLAAFASVKSSEPLKSMSVNGSDLYFNIAQITYFGMAPVSGEGPVALHFVGTDLAGNTAEATIQVDFFIDEGAPIISTDLVDNHISKNSLLTFSVSVSDSSPTITSVFQNGQQILQSGSKSIQVNAHLREGTNTFEIRSVDETSGNAAEPLMFSNIVLDDQVPVLSSIMPFDYTFSFDDTFDFSGTSNEKLASVTVDGNPVSLSADGLTFNAPISFAKTGIFVATVVAIDVAGNSTEYKIPLEVHLDDNAAVLTGRVDLSELAATCAAVNGAAFCWGWNAEGVFGNGTRDTTLVAHPNPTQVTGLDSGVTDIQVGWAHACALHNGVMKCWGNNSFGQLGTGVAGDHILTPTVATEFSGRIDAMAVGSYHTCVLTDGHVRCVGYNDRGALGDGTYTNSAIPVTPTGLGSGVSGISTNFLHTCAVQNNHLKCWGADNYPSPFENPALPQGAITGFSAGRINTCVAVDGKSYCFGSPNEDQRVITSAAIDGAPIAVPGMEQNTSFLTAGRISCGILSPAGALKCWSQGGDAEQVVTLESGVTFVSVGEFTTCAIQNGLLKCWGRNNLGQVGNGTVTSVVAVPTTIFDLNGSGPVPRFTISPIRANLNDPITFDASSSTYSGSDPITSYQWTFSDGITQSGQIIQRAFSASGVKAVTLRASTSTKSVDLTQEFIVDAAEVPRANFNFTLSSGLGILNVAFDGSTSTFGSLNSSSYTWDFGDGQSGTGSQISHLYSNAGTYQVKLAVIADNGERSEVTKSIGVFDSAPPMLNISSPNRFLPYGGATIEFAGQSNEPLSELFVNNVPVVFGPDLKSFVVSINVIGSGDRRFHIVGRDLAGNIGVEDFTLYVDADRPMLLGFSPVDGSTVYSKNNTIPISAQASEVLATARVNGQAMTLSEDRRSFQGILPNASDGDLVLAIEIEDALGNTNVYAAKIKHFADSLPPVITTGTSGNQYTSEPVFNLAVYVADSSETHTVVRRNGNIVSESSMPSFDVPTVLSEGINNFEITATDKANNATTVLVSNVVLDTQGPSISIVSPSANSTLSKYYFEVTGVSNEPLTAITVNGSPLAVGGGGFTFSGQANAPAQGSFSLLVRATDRAGNESEVLLPLNFMLILNPSLVGTDKAPDNKVVIFGRPGAVKPGLTVYAKAGWVNRNSAVAASDGSFSLPMEFFRTASLSVTDSDSGLTETMDVNFEVETILSGVIHDINGLAIVGAKVMVSGSSDVKITDVAGAFSFTNPPTGLQKIYVDATELSSETKEFSVASIAVNVGVNQHNVLEKPVYLAPVVKDGTETMLTELGGTLVRSANAPGVELSIPAGVQATFPNGAKSGSVNISIVQGDKTTIPTPDFATPDSVIYLEPTGLAFNQRVQLIVPNENELPPGVELAILSMNDNGSWEIDGMAAVSPNGNYIATKEGQGISHFSPKYAVPIGPVIREYNKLGQPGIDTFNGSLTTEIKMPSFKSLGRDLTPSLIYKSAWAKPTAVVTNFFDIPHQRVEFQQAEVVLAEQRFLRKPKISRKYCTSSEVGGAGSSSCFDNFFDYWKNHGSAVAGGAVRGAAWYQPESIMAKYFVGGLTSEEFGQSGNSSPADINFDTMTWQGIPNQALMSFGVELKDPQSGEYFASGIYPSVAHYDVRLKHIMLSTRKTFQGRGAGRVINQSNEYETSVLDEVFPSDMLSPIYVSNQVHSSAGRGWKIAGVQKIQNPGANRVVIEEGNGEISIYNANFTIETLFDASGSSVNLARGVSLHSWPLAAVVKESGSASTLQSIDLSVPSSSPVNIGSQLPNLGGTVKSAELCPVVGSVWKTPGHQYYEYNHSFTVPHKVEGLFLGSGGQVFATDSYEHSLFEGGSYRKIVGKTVLPQIQSSFLGGGERQTTNLGQLDQYCLANLKTSCSRGAFVASYGCASTRKIRKLKVVYRYEDSPASDAFRSPTQNLNSGQQPVAGSETLNSPMSVIGGPDNYLYVADYGNNRVLRISPIDGSRSVVAGNGRVGDDGDGGPAIQAAIYRPRGLAFDRLGNLYITSESGYIRMVSADGIISRFAGLPLGADGAVLADRVHASKAALGLPTGIVIDNDKQIMFVADTRLNRIIQINMTNSLTDLVAGGGSLQCGVNGIGDGELALNACLNKPTWLGIDSNGNVVVVDSGNNRIRRINLYNSPENKLAYLPAHKNGSNLEKSADGSYTLVERSGIKHNFDSLGSLTSIVDRLGRTSSYSYDSSQRLTGFTDEVGQVTLFEYSGDKLSRVVDPANRTTSFTYSGNFLNQVLFPDGSTQSFNYSSEGLLTEERNKSNIPNRYVYNSYSRLEKVIRPDDSELLINDGISETVGNNYTSGSVGAIKSVEAGEIVDGIISPRGIETKYSFDLNGYVTTVIDSEGKLTRVDRDEDGKVLKITRSDNSTILIKYGESGDIVESVDSSTNERRKFEYNSFGQIVDETVGTGIRTVRVFDDQTGLLVAQTDPSGSTQTFNYTSFGLLESTSKMVNTGEFKTRTLFYDSLGRLVQQTDSTGRSKSMVYDSAGNIREKTVLRDSSVSLVSRYEFDEFNRVISVTSPKNEVTAIEYNDSGLITEIRDPNQKSFNFEYNLLGQLSKRIDPRGQWVSYTYDNDGNVIGELFSDGVEKRIEYDANNRIVRKTLPDDDYHYSYDVRGNLVYASNKNSEIFRNVDPKGRVTGARVTGRGDLSAYPNVELVSGYNANDSVTSMVDSLGGSYSYSYYSDGRLKSLINAKGEVFGFTFDGLGRMVGLSRPGVNSVYQYGSGDFLANIKNVVGEQIISYFNYNRDSQGLVRSIESESGTMSFGYDLNSYLTSASQAFVRAPASTTSFDEQFSYDDGGNRLTDGAGSYLFDDTRQSLVESPQYQYQYDQRGNLIGKINKVSGEYHKLEYSSENQLIGYRAFASIASINPLRESSYSYDALGRRMRKIVVDHNAMTDPYRTFSRQYVYNNSDILLEFDGSGRLLARYTYAPLQVDNILAADVTVSGVEQKLAPASGTYLFMKDHLGTVSSIVDVSGGVIQRHEYSAFGSPVRFFNGQGQDVTETPSSTMAFTFTSRELDRETGLLYLRSRYYDPHVGRFLQADSDEGTLGVPITATNKYSYALNLPTGLVDNSGRSPFIIGAVIGAAVGFTVSLFTDDSELEGALYGAAIGATLGFGATTLSATSFSLSTASAAAAAATTHENFFRAFATNLITSFAGQAAFNYVVSAIASGSLVDIVPYSVNEFLGSDAYDYLHFAVAFKLGHQSFCGEKTAIPANRCSEGNRLSNWGLGVAGANVGSYVYQSGF